MFDCDYCGKQVPREEIRGVGLEVGGKRSGAVLLCHQCGDDLGVVDLFQLLQEIAAHHATRVSTPA